MAEEEVSVEDLFPEGKLEGEDEAATPPRDPDLNEEDGGEETPSGELTPEAANKQIKAALKEHLEKPSFACFAVDLLSPGHAVVNLRGGALAKMPPWQHFAVAAVGILAVAYATNPSLRANFTNGLRSKKPATEKKEQPSLGRAPLYQPDGDTIQ